METIFITGATGYIGGSVANALLSTGYRVKGLVRKPEAALWLAERGIEPVQGSLDDLDLLFREAAAADGVIHTASADHRPSISALIAGLAGSGKPLLHTSGSSVVGDDARGAWCSDQVFEDEGPLVVSPSKQARRDMDLQLLASSSQGVRSIVICPSNIYGTGRGYNADSVQIPLLVANALEQQRVQIVGAGLNVWSNVHLDDVVSLYLLALKSAPAGAFYFAESGETSFAAIGTALATRLGLGAVESLPAELAAQRWGEACAYYSLGSNSRVRAVRARRELGWQPTHNSVIDWILNEMPVA